MATNGTDVTYNGVTLSNVNTRQWEMEAIYDEDDTLSYYRLQMQFDTIFLPYDSGGGGQLGVQAGGDAPEAWNINKRLLMQPRELLTITMNGSTILEVTPSGEKKKKPPFVVKGANGKEQDVHNGPKPMALEFDTVLGSTSIRATYTIEAYLSPCNDKVPKLLASRWTVTETMDEDFFITRKFTGFVKKRSATESSASYRNWMYPPLEEGFKRVHVSFSEHANHLGIDWAVTDRQVHVAPPYPCTSLEGHQTETTGDGITWFSEVKVRASGSPNSSKRAMIAQCCRIIEMRIGYDSTDAIGNLGKFLVKGCTIVDSFGSKNQVEMVMRIQHLWGSTEGKQKFRTFLTNLRARVADPAYYDLDKAAKFKPVEPEPYDKLKSPLPPKWGINPHGEDRKAKAAARWEHYLQDLCQAGPDVFGRYKPGDPKTEGGETQATMSETKVSYDRGTTFPAEESQYDTTNNIYLMARVNDEYNYDPRRAVLPVLGHDNVYQYAGASGLGSYVVNIGRPVIYRILTVEYERLGEWPELPDLKDTYTDPLNGIKFSLLKHRLVTKPPAPGQDGKQIIFATWAQYIYVCKTDLRRNMISNYDWSLISLPLTQVTHHIEKAKTWKDRNGSKLDSGQGKTKTGGSSSAGSKIT